MCTYLAATAASAAPNKKFVSTSYIPFRPDYPAFGHVKKWFTSFEASADLANCVNITLYALNHRLKLTILSTLLVLAY